MRNKTKVFICLLLVFAVIASIYIVRATVETEEDIVLPELVSGEIVPEEQEVIIKEPPANLREEVVDVSGEDAATLENKDSKKRR